MNELVSVIVPVYNVEKYLDKCVESIVSQTYKNLEIILVDDGSPDKCPGLCDEWAKKDERIKVIHKENGGVSSARNAALDAAEGEYLSFVDGDDYISPEFVGRMFEECNKNDLDICSCNHYRVDENEKILDDDCLNERLVVGNTNILNAYFSDDFINPSVAVKLYSSSVLKNVRFDKNVKVGEDFLFNYCCLKNAERVKQINDCLYYYTDREGSAVYDLSAEYVNRWKNTKKIVLENDNADIQDVLLYKYRRELISCLRQLLASNNKGLIDECYDGICDELKALHEKYPDIKSSRANKITLSLVLFNRKLFKFLYIKYKRL